MKTIAARLQIAGPLGRGMRRFVRERRSSVAVLFALLALPLIGLVGLAIEYAMLNQTHSTMELAARGAALNAAKIAAAGNLDGDANYVVEGTTAGTQWFAAQAGKAAGTLSTTTPTVTITPGTTLVAKVTYSGTMASFFGKVFGVNSYVVAVEADASVPLAPYVEVIVMLDNSSSMGIGASVTDIATMMRDSPCDPSNYFTSTTGVAASYSNIDNLTYYAYECNYYGTYDGQNSPWNGPSCPFSPGNTTYTYTSDGPGTPGGPIYDSPGNPPHSSPRYYGSNYTCPGKAHGYTIYPGPPCAFACHSDGTQPAGLGNDLWAMARRDGVTLRLDLLKNASQQMISAMQARDPSGAALSLGVYTFDTGLTRIYPTSGGEAGSDWSDAAAKVGLPPVAGSASPYTETGIQPAVALVTSSAVSLNSDTFFASSMDTLAGDVTAAGSGATAATPRKALFLITDGIYDETSGARGAMPYSYCQQFKDMGFSVYVLYTTYYPLMQNTYLHNFMSIVEGSGGASVTYNLQHCSSSSGASDLSTYYVQVTDQAGVTTALQSFLNSIVSSPLRFTK